MKTLKYFMIGVALMGVSATATAQDGTKADIDAVKNIISSKPADMDKQLNNYYKKNKKNAENLIAFSKALYEAKDTARARLFADYTLKADKNYAPAYIMLGDLAALAEDGGAAAAQYEQAIYFDPKNPEAYRKYASVYRKSPSLFLPESVPPFQRRGEAVPCALLCCPGRERIGCKGSRNGAEAHLVWREGDGAGQYQ